MNMPRSILQYLKKEEYDERLKQETLQRWQEIEENKVISNEVVMSWLDSWGTSYQSNQK